jgi:hypothetical protein
MSKFFAAASELSDSESSSGSEDEIQTKQQVQAKAAA